MDSYDILVILLSIALLVFLTVNIILGVILIKVLRRVQTAAEALQSTAEDVRNFTSRLRTIGDMSFVGSAIANVAKAFKKGGKKQ